MNNALATIILTAILILAISRSFIVILNFVKGRIKLASIKRHNNRIDEMYQDLDPFHESVAYRDKQKMPNKTLTYGEILPTSFAQMLEITQPQPGEIYYDLDCGAGKAVFTAALCFPKLVCRGVELLPPLHAIAENLLTQMDTSRHSIKFICADFMSVNFQDADIVFLNATCFQDDDWRDMQCKLDQLKTGCRIITCSKKIGNRQCKLQDSGMFMMSWGWCSTFIYVKTLD